MNIKINLAANLATASIATATATVEAEYGQKVIQGKKVTLAHHVQEYRHFPAPCCREDIPSLTEGDTILVSHLDLDTIGGCLALMDQKPEVCEGFWALAGHIDVRGPHHLAVAPFGKEAKEALVAFWAWSARNRAPRRDANVLHDVTEDVVKAGEFLANLSEEDILAGQKWQEGINKAVENCLIEETLKFRVFSTDGPFCHGAYWSNVPRWGTELTGVDTSRQGVIDSLREIDSNWRDTSGWEPGVVAGRVVPAIVSYSRKFGSITLSFEGNDGRERRDACKIMQSLFGPHAGGHKGIAGSPRGVVMGRKECLKMARWILGRRASRRVITQLALKMRRGC